MIFPKNILLLFLMRLYEMLCEFLVAKYHYFAQATNGGLG